MRIFVILGLLCSLLLTGCEFFTPDTSRALSQTQQIDELHKQTQQLERQANALERLADEVGATETQGSKTELKGRSPSTASQ
jgi:cell division protein FtsB